jgi:multiple sugar transport system permease protein
MTSIKKPVDAFAIPPVWNFKPTFNAYYQLWVERGFTFYLKNTLIVAFASVLFSMPIASLAGYALARYRSRISFILIMVAMIFRALPRMAFVLPYYYLARLTGLYDTKILLILIVVALNQPFSIWLLRSFFMDIPKELEESAMIDGCTYFQAFRRVIVPVMLPGVATSGIFTFYMAYNEFMFPVVLTAERAVTLPVAISQFGAENIKYWTISAAGALSIALPVLIMVLLAQKLIIRGLTAGAVKG